MNNFKSNYKDIVKRFESWQEKTLEKIGGFVESEAVQRCPKLTGNLSNSIAHVVDMKVKATHIGTPVDYGIYVEKGTRKQRAQPYLTPAVEENINNIGTIIKNTEF